MYVNVLDYADKYYKEFLTKIEQGIKINNSFYFLNKNIR